MHYKTLAIFKVSPEIMADLNKKLDQYKPGLIDMFTKKLTKPFDQYMFEQKVTPYKRYLDQEEINSIMQSPNLDISNEEQLIKHLKTGDNVGGKDEKGIYSLTPWRENPNGKFDAWGIIDIFSIEHYLKIITSFDIVPTKIFTPDCKLIEYQGPEYFLFPGSNNKKNDESELDAWCKELKDILSTYHKNHLIALIDCHS